jgi:hypothetical protein
LHVYVDKLQQYMLTLAMAGAKGVRAGRLLLVLQVPLSRTPA